MAASPAFPGVFFCFAAMVLLIFVSVSVPVWNEVYFLKTNIGGQALRFGVWGYTGSAKSLGYTIDSSVLGVNVDNFLSSGVLKNLTYILVLHPVGAGLSFLAVVFGLCGTLSYSRIGTILMTVTAFLALIVTIIAFAIDMILWNIVRNRIENETGNNSTADLGNANWLTAGALAALILGTCAAGCGSFGRYRHRKAERY